MTDPHAIAASLSEAQREALLRQPCPSWWGNHPAAMPHREPTGFALKRKGLCVASATAAWPLTPLGLTVRRALLENSHD